MCSLSDFTYNLDGVFMRIAFIKPEISALYSVNDLNLWPMVVVDSMYMHEFKYENHHLIFSIYAKNGISKFEIRSWFPSMESRLKTHQPLVNTEQMCLD